MRIWILMVGLLLAAACAEPPAPPTLAERYSGDVRPAPGRTQAVISQTLTYWAAIEDGRWHQAYRAHALEFQEVTPFEPWLAEVRGQPMTTRRPTGIHWSKGAHRHQGPELYAIVSWTDPTGRTGRVIWRETRPGRYLIERTDPF